MQVGDRINKPIDRVQYSEMAQWCNENACFMAEHDTYYEITIIPESSYQEQLQQERIELKNYLNETDWIVVKCMERGLDIKTEYPKEYILRGKARTRIDEIDEELA